jgi:Catalase-related immune-responsive
VRAKPELFAEHYNQAKLFYESQSPAERAHIAAAFRFELSKVTVPAIRSRMLASLRNASEDLATKVAEGLNMPLEAAARVVTRSQPRPDELIRHLPAPLAGAPTEAGFLPCQAPRQVGPGPNSPTQSSAEPKEEFTIANASTSGDKARPRVRANRGKSVVSRGPSCSALRTCLGWRWLLLRARR